MTVASAAVMEEDNFSDFYKGLWELAKKVIGWLIGDIGAYHLPMVSTKYAKQLTGKEDVLALYDPETGEIAITDHPFNRDSYVREFASLHELGHKYLEEFLKPLYGNTINIDEEVFADVYALDKMIKKYGNNVVDYLKKIGVVEKDAITKFEEYKNLMKNPGVRWK